MCAFVIASEEESWIQNRAVLGDQRPDPVFTVRCSGASGDISATGGEKEMNAEYFISAVIALLLLAYLVYAMLKPERF